MSSELQGGQRPQRCRVVANSFGRYGGGVPKLPDTAGSPRARIRLIAVLVLGLLTAYWGVYALILLFLPDNAYAAAGAVLFGAVCLVVAGLLALATWGTAKRIRGLHIFAVVVTATMAALFAIGLALTFGGKTMVSIAAVPVDVWVFGVANLVGLVLLSLTIPRRVEKS